MNKRLNKTFFKKLLQPFNLFIFALIHKNVKTYTVACLTCFMLHRPWQCLRSRLICGFPPGVSVTQPKKINHKFPYRSECQPANSIPLTQCMMGYTQPPS